MLKITTDHWTSNQRIDDTVRHNNQTVLNHNKPCGVTTCLNRNRRFKRVVTPKGSEYPPPEAGTLRLYSNRFCPYAERARLVLAHKNIPYETVNIHLQEKPEGFSKLNPLSTVPVLQKDDVVLYESLVICEYLDEVYPGQKVVPADPVQKAKDRMFMERFSKVVTKYYGVLRAMRASDSDAKKENAVEVMQGYSMIEEELKQRNTKFMGGDKPMLVDFVMWSHLERMLALSKVVPELVIKEGCLPLFRAWIDTIKTVPAVQAVMLSGETHMGFFKTAVSGAIDYDYALEE